MAGLVPERDFPLLSRRIEQRRLIYLDSATTALRPRAVMDAVVDFYRSGAEIDGGVHSLAREAAAAYERAREVVAGFIGARPREVVFTAGTTDSIHLVAEGLGLRAGDNVVTSILDHHSNVLPWLRRCELRTVPEAADGSLELDRLHGLIDARTRLVALAHASHVTGAIHPIAAAAAIAHRRGVPILVDGAQSVPHLATDVAALDADFLGFSGHKMLAPGGIGVLFVREALWEELAVGKLGGGNAELVQRDGFVLRPFPHRLEAGAPNVEGALGLAAAIDYLGKLGMDRVAMHGVRLAQVMRERFEAIPDLELLGPVAAARKIPILSFSSPSLDPVMLGALLGDSHKVMARAGTQCAQPYFELRGLSGALRLSGYVYTREDDIQLAGDATEALIRQLGK